MTGNAVVLNFSGGETSPRSRGRFDQPWFQTSAKKMVNFIAELQGPARFRPGFIFAGQTRLGQAARIFDFEINDETVYLLEFTPSYMRVRNPLTYALQTSLTLSITSITIATAALVTVASAAGVVAGQEVILSGMLNMPQLNNKQFLVANLSGNTFNLADPVTGALFSTAPLSTAETAGTASVVYELTTPYSALDIQSLQVATPSGVMYLTCGTQPPQKITVGANNQFSIGSFSRVNDPFASLGNPTLSVVGVGLGINTAIQFAAGSVVATGRIYNFAGVGGTIQLNGNSYPITLYNPTASGQNYQIFSIGVNMGQVPAGLIGQVVLITISSIVSTTAPGAALLNGVQAYWQVGTPSGQIGGQLFMDAGCLVPYAPPVGAANNASYAANLNITVNSGAYVGNTYAVTGANLDWATGSTPTLPVALIAGLNSTAWGAYTSGGTASPAIENPLAVACYEGRLVYAGTNLRPDCLFLSMAPDNNGNAQYDNFTGGSNADNACFFQLAPTGGSTSFISWARGGPDYLFIGTFGGPYRVSGSGLDIPITPSSINVRQFDTAGCEETMPAGLAQMFFVQRAGKTLRSIKVINPYLATFESADMCLNAEQIGYSPIQRVILQRGRPDALWIYSANGQLAGMSVHVNAQNADMLTGWHRHQIGGNGVVQDIAVVPRQTGYDQLWVVVQRVINGVTRCYVEVMADDVVFPDPEDFFGSAGPVLADAPDDPEQTESAAGAAAKAADLVNWQNAVWRAQANYIHMDAEAAYDGSLRGINASATLTPSAVGAVQQAGQAAVPIALTASQPVFTAQDVGSEIWVKPNALTGLGAGRARIIAYVSSQQVQAVVTVPFQSLTAIAAGDWYFAVSTFYGFGHLEGTQVAVVTDGAVFSDGGQTNNADFPTITVTQGTIKLPAGNLGQQPRAAVLRAGLPYIGMLETHNLEMGGRSGPAQAKPRNIAEINIRFMNSLGCEYGTSLYAMARVNHRLSDAVNNRPAPVFSGIRRVKLEDTWSGIDDITREKNVFICQRLPLPAVVQFLDLKYGTADDGGGED